MLLPFGSIDPPYIHRFVRQCLVILTIPLLWDTRLIGNPIRLYGLRSLSADFSELQTHSRRNTPVAVLVWMPPGVTPSFHPLDYQFSKQFSLCHTFSVWNESHGSCRGSRSSQSLS